MIVYSLRASAAPAWVVCHAFPRMQLGRPDISDTTVREEGTAFHWAALMVWLGHHVTTSTVAPNGVTITDEMLDGIDAYLSHIRSWPGQASLEMSLSAARIHPQCGGTADAWAYAPQIKTLYVADAKFGYRWRDPFLNWQLLVYVAGLLDYLNIIHDQEIIVEMSIFQPRAYRQDGPWFKWRVRASDLRAQFNILEAAALETMSANPKAVTGPQCNDCNGRLHCSTFLDAVGTVLDTAGEPVEQDLSVATLDVQMRRVDRSMELLEAAKVAYDARAEMFLRQGKQFRSYEMQATAGRLQWLPGMESVVIAIGESMGKQLAKPQTPITPTQAKNLVGEEVISAFCERKPSSLKLQRIDPHKARKTFERV
jgi:hypothetical protein